MKKKNTFTLSKSLIGTVKHLTEQQAGVLFKAILAYSNDEKVVVNDKVANVLFQGVKYSLEKEKENWAETQKTKTKTERIGLPTPPTDKEKPKTIEQRKEEFKNQIIEESQGKYSNYPKELNKFYKYWTEKNVRGKKMRFEKQKTWQLSRRLDTWFDNVSEWNKKPDKIQVKTTARQALENKVKQNENNTFK